MIPRTMWKQLEAVGHRVKPRKPRAIGFCGWDPRDPRRDEYDAYMKAWKVAEPDPAFTKLECAGPWEMYSFDHTKVPKSDGNSQGD